MHERRYAAPVERLRLQERVERMEIPRVIDLCLEGIQAATAIDIGTGSGLFAEELQKRGLAVTGIDPNPEMLDAAKGFVPQAEFRSGTVEAIPFPDKSFDLVFLGHVLHESDDLRQALLEIKRCAKTRVVVLEWPYKQEEIGPPFEHRLDPAIVEQIAREVGFTSVELIPLSRMLVYRLS